MTKTPHGRTQPAGTQLRRMAIEAPVRLNPVRHLVGLLTSLESQN